MDNGSLRVSGDDTERVVRNTLMDGKPFVVDFKSETNQTERYAWFCRVNAINTEIGGGWVEIIPDPTDANRYLLKPGDDPNNHR